MNHILSEDRNQLQFLSLEQIVPVDSWARVIDFFVDMLPLDEPGFKHANPEKEGRPPYNPSTLVSSKNISGVGYNIQAATDGKHKLFVHTHIGKSIDKRELAQAALDIKAALGLPIKLLPN